MNKAIIGRKLGMTQVFAPDGRVIPVTVVEAGPCPIVQVKTLERDGYTALKLGFDETTEKALNKPQLGQFKKAGVAPQKVLKEVRYDDVSAYSVGQAVKCDVFAAGDKVDVSGVTKGHGSRRYQKVEQPPSEGNARRRPRTQRGRLHGREQHAEPRFQG